MNLMPNKAVPLGSVFQALVDPTRRAVIARLARGPASTLELARPFAMSLPAFTQHMDVLERTALVRSSKEGRVRTYTIESATLKAAEDWLAGQRRVREAGGGRPERRPKPRPAGKRR